MATLTFGTLAEANTRSAALWTAVLGRAKNPGDVTTYLYNRRTRTGDATDDAGLPNGVNHVIDIPARDSHLDTLLRADQMTAAETAALVSLYSAWSSASVAYAVGDIRSYNGTLYKVVQAHTSQESWTPSATPALWTTCAPVGVIPDWVQPGGSVSAYALNDQVTHSGRVWKSLTAANTYEPGVVGTWRDQSTPPLWVQPSGAVGLWQVNDVAFYNGQTWRNTSANNSFAPGVFGWTVVV